MKAIIKANEPVSLTEHRTKKYSSFANLNKNDTRASLLMEQGYICCYCMRRIPESGKMPGTKIEHFLCQEHNRKEELNYKNMLLACFGNEGAPKRLQTCDTKKGNLDLTYSPSNQTRNIESLIQYKPNGEIYSSDKVFNIELEEILNLNVKNLVDNRRVIYEEIQNRIRIAGRQLGSSALKRKFLESEKAKLLALKNGKYAEFCMIGVYVIDKKLKKINR